MLLQLLVNGIIMGAIYSLVSLGFALVYNTTRIFHIAYAGIYMFSAYMILSFYKYLQFPLFLSYLLAIILAIILSILIEKIVYLPLVNKKSSLNVLLISSIGVMIVIVNSIAMLYGNETKIINPNISKSVQLGGIIITFSQVAQFVVSIILLLFFLLFLKYSNLGIKTRAMRDDPVLFTVFGKELKRQRLVLFGLSALLAGTGSTLIAYDVGMDPYVGMPMLLNAVVALIIGGVGRFEAPIVGGFIVGILQSLAVWVFSSRWQDAVTFSLLLIFLVFRPQGLLGEKQRAV